MYGLKDPVGAPKVEGKGAHGLVNADVFARIMPRLPDRVQQIRTDKLSSWLPDLIRELRTKARETVFLLDGSGSVTRRVFEKEQRSMTAQLLSQVLRSGSAGAVVQFSSPGSVVTEVPMHRAREGDYLPAVHAMQYQAQLKDSISNLSLMFQPNDQTLLGSFSAASTPNFARKYSLESS